MIDIAPSDSTLVLYLARVPRFGGIAGLLLKIVAEIMDWRQTVRAIHSMRNVFMC